MEVVIPLIGAHLAISVIFGTAYVAVLLMIYILNDTVQW